jgi:6-phosphogluconolactonase
MARRDFLFVGCLNRRLPYFRTANGRGIAVFAFDPGSGGCRPVAAAEGIANPSYLSFDPRRCCLYATSEIAGADEGTVTAYRFDPVGGNLDQINSRPTLGGITAHCSLSQDGRFLLVANYGNGPADKRPGQAIAVFPIRGDGGLDAPSGSIRHLGSGPNAARQERPHAHCAVASPDDRLAVVADLGIDAVLCHRLAPDGSLMPDPDPLRLKPGAGPRSIAFHPALPFAYVINELDSTIAALGYDGAEGRFRLIQTVPTLPAGESVTNYPADLQFGKDGRFLYGSNRGHDSIVIHSVDAATGRLALIGHCPSGGRTPRSLAIDPTGRWLLAANQNLDCIAIFQIDTQRGTLSDTGRRIEIGTPMCVKLGTA